MHTAKAYQTGHSFFECSVSKDVSNGDRVICVLSDLDVCCLSHF